MLSSIGNDFSQTYRARRILITGGTGSFGHHIVHELLRFDPAAVIVFSRDEDKQFHMRHEYKGQSNLRFVIGDVRDLARVREAMRGVDIVFHAAALKQVPSTEDAPFEAVLTNVVGAQNVRCAAIEAGVKAVVAVSTDKAVKPVNVMGMSKALQERIMIHGGQLPRSDTRFLCVRYGNVLGSRGSVVPFFRQRIAAGQPLPITHSEMTRFLLTLSTAVELVLRAVADGESGELWVRKMPAARIVDLARVMARGITGNKDYPLVDVGIRPGEKIHEVLVSEEEMTRAVELDEYFRVCPWGTSGSGGTSPAQREYSSDGVHQMTDEELHALLSSEGWFGPNGDSNKHRAL